MLVTRPTGSGKSLIFWVAGLLLGSLTIVVEPLIALELDQVRKLQERGVAVRALHSGLKTVKRQEILKLIQTGELSFLYVSAEQLQNSEIAAVLRRAKISFVAIDEAHTITKYGHGFREEYLQIGQFIQSLPKRPVVGAFTATATPAVQVEIAESLKLHDPYLSIGAIYRENLQLAVCEVGPDLKWPTDKAVIEQTKREYIIKLMQKQKNGKTIIYCNTVKKAKKLHKYLKKQGIKSEKYHGRKMTFKKKKKALLNFMEGKAQVMVATSAFGLGVDIPDVRLVIHHSPPMGLDDYLQEAGRAGRDGKKALCVLLWHAADFRTNEGLILKQKNRMTGAAVKQKKDSLKALRAYAEEKKKCRWKLLSEFLGEKEIKKCKKSCDHCKNN